MKLGGNGECQGRWQDDKEKARVKIQNGDLETTLLRFRTGLAILLRVSSSRSSLGAVRLSLETLVVLLIVSVWLLLASTVCPTSVASIRGAAASVGSLLRSSRLLALALTRRLTLSTSGRGWWARDALRGIVRVELLVNKLWDRRNLSTELLLNLVEIESVVPIDEVYSHT